MTVRVGWTAAIVAALAGLLAISGAFQSQSATALGTANQPAGVRSAHTEVTLGVEFSSSHSGTISALSFYRPHGNTGSRTGSLWTGSGRRLASVTFPASRRAGWQKAALDRPITIQPDVDYVASYTSPSGTYAFAEGTFRHTVSTGDLRVPAHGGLSSRGDRFPRRHTTTDYLINVSYHASSPTATPTPTSTSGPTAGGTPPPTSTSVLDLPRIPWEGGPSYWGQFSKAKAAGWTNPDFFPIVAWWGGFTTDAQVQYDKSLGINTYTGGMWSGTPYSLFQDNGVYWVGNKLNSSFTSSSANWVGDFLDDEVDGRYSPAAGEAHLQDLVDQDKDDGRFDYANFSKSVITTDLPAAVRDAYVNDFTNVVSVDQYWYTSPWCSQVPFRGNVFLDPVSQASCRSSSSYGKTVTALRQVDSTDGKLQPLWNFVELLNGGPGPSSPAVYITPGQLQGAVMDSIIHEARGIVYFNQSLSGPCINGNLVRETEEDPTYCSASQVAAMKQVDQQIESLASVINTQSYQYTFGPGLDTMLKTQGGYAYIFAMTDGSSAPGSRTFQLPSGIDGKSVQVLNEDRTIPVSSTGTFTDSFANEYSYHIYKVALQG